MAKRLWKQLISAYKNNRLYDNESDNDKNLLLVLLTQKNQIIFLNFFFFLNLLFENFALRATLFPL